MNRKNLFAALAIAALIAVVVLRPPDQTQKQADDAAPERGLIVAVEAEIRGFDPLQLRLMGVSTLSTAVTMLETLLTLDDRGNVRPGLALSLDAEDPSRLSWVARLRDGVRFHDGSDFDADDVVAHFERLLDPAGNCTCRGVLSPLAAVEAIDRLTVRFRLHEPWESLPILLAEPSMISLLGLWDSSVADPHRMPVGTGPYQFDAWSGAGTLRVKRNEAYRASATDAASGAGFPFVEFRVLPDQQTRFASVLAGDVDVIWTLHARDAERAARSDRLQVLRHVGNGARTLPMNMASEHLGDLRVRRALAHATSARQYASAVYLDMAPPAENPFGPASWIQCGDTGYPAYDPDKARQLLADYGQPVTIELLHTPTGRGRATAQILQQFWQDVGVTVNLQSVEQVQLVSRVVQRKYDIGAWRIRDSQDPDADLNGLFSADSRWNVSGYRNDELEQRLVQARAERDRAARAAAYCGIAATLHRDLPFLYLVHNTYFAIAARDLQGIPPMSGGALSVSGVRRRGGP